ncbi:MAG TPA: hypothetical protein VGR35_21040 [Tepidisphaeraceae bacterium]|nr:hypothetical protein [Tepidisphaeraceae bacterium]
MKLNVLADTISTYLTLASALVLPVLMCVWVRSYLVSDRIYYAEDGRAIVAGLTNGELTLWTGATHPSFQRYEHRSRQANWGWSHRRTFQRVAGGDYVWFIGFAYAEAEVLPWRGAALTGRAIGVCMPIWFLVLIFGFMPFRLLARNMQSSQEFLAQRAAEERDEPDATHHASGS